MRVICYTHDKCQTHSNRPQKTLKTRKIFIAPQETYQRPPNNLSPRSEKLKEQSLGVHKKKQARGKKKTDLLLLTPNTKKHPRSPDTRQDHPANISEQPRNKLYLPTNSYPSRTLPKVLRTIAQDTLMNRQQRLVNPQKTPQ